MERVLLVGDLHCSEHDERAVTLAAQISEAFRPDRVVFLGDCVDAGWATDKFRVDKTRVVGALEREVSAWERVLAQFHAPLIQMLPGNHERRIRDFVWNNPALAGWKSLEPQQLFRLGNRAKWVEAGYVRLARGRFIVTHGSRVSKWAGMSAKSELQDVWGTSGASGHTHRLGAFYHRLEGGLRVWVEAGSLCRNPPLRYDPSVPAPLDWHQGVVVLYVNGDQFHVQPIPFTLSYRAMLDGRVFRA